MNNKTKETIKDGGPAFPIGERDSFVHAGMTLRDYFASKALQGRLSCGYDEDGDSSYFEARICYQIADQMLKVREE